MPSIGDWINNSFHKVLELTKLTSSNKICTHSYVKAWMAAEFHQIYITQS
jgi:hypothetical protein